MSARKRPAILRPLSWLTTQDAVWATIRALHAEPPAPPFTTGDIARRVKIGPSALARHLSRLVSAGIVERVRPPSVGVPAMYRLVWDVGVEPPRITAAGVLDNTPTDQERMWQAMKALPTFDARDIMVSTGIASLNVVKHYLRELARAGYLAVVQPGTGGRGGTLARLRLLASRNTGPRPPAVRKNGVVFDLNQNRQVWPAVAA